MRTLFDNKIIPSLDLLLRKDMLKRLLQNLFAAFKSGADKTEINGCLEKMAKVSVSETRGDVKMK